MNTDFLEFEEIDQHIPTPEEMEMSFHFTQVQEAKTIFEHHLTKQDIPVIVSTMVESVLEKGNPLHIAEKVKIMEMIIDGFKSEKRYKDYAIEQATLYGKDGYTSPTGAKITVMNAPGGQPDFKVCNDPVYAALEKQLKERKEFLKGIPSKGQDIITEDGEVITIFPPNKPASVETIKITLK